MGGSAVFALGTVVSSIAVGWVTDEVIRPRFEDGSVGGGTLALGLTFIVVIGMVRAGGVVVRRVWASKAMWLIAGSLSDSVVDRLVEQPVSWHARRADGDLISRVGVDADASVSVMAPIPFATGTMFMIVVSCVWLLVGDLPLGLVATVVFPLLMLMNLAYERRVAHYYDDAQEHLGLFSAGVHESFEGVQLVKAYGAEARETERLSTFAGSVRDARVRAVRIRGTFEALLDVVPSLTNVGLVLLGAMRVGDGAITVGDLSSYIYLFTLLVFPLRVIGFALAELPHSSAGWNRIQALINEPLEADPRQSIGRAPDGVAVAIDDVSFAYDVVATSATVLSGVSFTMRPGTITAVVGPTGSGKSTLVEIVGGLLAPTAGAVRVRDGATSMVFQEAFLLSGTVRQNVVMAADVGDDEVWRALRLAAADEFVRSLPDGLEAIVGERGVGLSGGQRQRLALARALVRRPSLLILDDTTSALDPATEATVLTNLRAAASDTTVLMVASRPSTIALADDVVFLSGGRVRAHDTHAVLMAEHAAYRQLVEAFEAERDAGRSADETVIAGE